MPAWVEDKLKLALDGFYSPVAAIFKIILIIIISAVLIKIGRFIIRKIFSNPMALGRKISGKRLDTIATLVQSVYRYSVYIMAGVSILAELSKQFNLQSIMTAAGIGGLALGFGAQSLIKDVISGMFILLEDQYAVGDTITVEGLNGTVEEMELRVTKIRSFNGDLFIVPNGEIKKVINHTRGNKAVIVDIPLAYSTDIQLATQAAEDICKRVNSEFSTIMEAPKVLGVTEMARDSVKLRIFAMTKANEQYEVERRIRRLVIEEFNKLNIEFSEKNRITLDELPAKGVGAHG